ncbi:amidohydrolase family protein [Nocardia blacklockiae]|uniref:amidohydrolase family protein n=1 Tax=Nocardia blacklockiae TaxID=480036 RepID=UPI001894CB4A|nr:amidohydrolase family protein [Nocardia blacklockiae]MBF6174360.1 amidohydrolase family protein [Nocardia blacklockiae]
MLSGATLIDGTGAPPRPNSTIALLGDRIVAVGDAAELRLPARVRPVDLTGKFVIPGLWDMHTHAASAERFFPPLHVVNGVTGIREMWGDPATHDLRRRIERGQALGPRMVIASNIIDGAPGIWPGSETVSTDTEARHAVRRARQDGADFVKVYSLLSRETLTAVADEAHRVGLRFAGHVPHRIPVQEAVDLGQYTLEHMYGMLLSTSARADELYARIDAAPGGSRADRIRLEQAAAESHSPRRAAALIEQLIRYNCWQSPTLVVQQRLMTGTPPGNPGDERLRYLPEYLRRAWQEQASAPAAGPSAVLQSNFQARLRLLETMSEAGVGIVAGTDAGNPFVFPGFALHEELELLVQAGLSPMRALQAATRDAARCLGMAHRTGTVESGKFADLVVLDGDPLTSIGNTRRIHAVVCRGRYLSSTDRERILREVETAARQADSAPPDRTHGGCCG